MRRLPSLQSDGPQADAASAPCYNCATAASSDRDAATLAKELISYDAV